jgi:hypothetical protein
MFFFKQKKRRNKELSILWLLLLPLYLFLVFTAIVGEARFGLTSSDEQRSSNIMTMAASLLLLFF